MDFIKEETIHVICFVAGIFFIIFGGTFPIGIWASLLGGLLIPLALLLTYVRHKGSITQRSQPGLDIIFWISIMLLLDTLWMVGLIIVVFALYGFSTVGGKDTFASSPEGIAVFLLLAIIGGSIIALYRFLRKKTGLWIED